jgi:phosphoglycerol geranylgeranyltransferase
MHMTLLDPDEEKPEFTAYHAKMAEFLGTDVIVLGGSTGVTIEVLINTIERIKENVSIPVVLFPTTASAISTKADATYFMSILNSRNPRFLMGEQMLVSAWLKKSGLEVISMGYIIVEPGMKVGQVREAELIKRENILAAVGYGVAAELLGMDLIYLEAGSGAPEPVPAEMIEAVKKELSIPVCVGGGVRTENQALMLRNAGADILVTGCIVEEYGIFLRLKKVIEAFKKGII